MVVVRKARRKTKKKMIAESRELARLVEGFVRTHGGGESERLYRWILPTKLGNLRINVHEDEEFPSEYLTIFSRFDEPDRACERLGSFSVNCYSGKWNFHGGDAATPIDLFEHWARQVVPILVASQTLRGRRGPRRAIGR